jgi:uncharacterized protein
MRLGSPPPDADVDTRLHWAARDGDQSGIEALLIDAASINGVDQMGHTPLHHAVAGNQLEAVRRLVAAGADVNGQASGDGWQDNTPLGDVAANGTFEMAELLIHLGADPRIPGWMGNTPLDRAKERHDAEGQHMIQLFEKAISRGKLGAA